MTDIVELSMEQAPRMASIASNAHSHPMNQKLIESCFGGLYIVFGLIKESELLGFVIAHQIFEDATIIDICVEPKVQGEGYGKALINHAIRFVKANEAQVVLLEVRSSGKAAIALYESVGFVQTGTRKNYYPCDIGKEDAILMNLDL